MKSENYQSSITVSATPGVAYAALTQGFSLWWTQCDAVFDKVGDRIKFCFPPNVSNWTFEAVRLVPNDLVELECIDAFHKIIEKPNASKTEWLGSRLIWKLLPEKDRTRIVFEHLGLSPKLDCYDVCEAGWDFFFMESLKLYLDTGHGTPHRT